MFVLDLFLNAKVSKDAFDVGFVTIHVLKIYRWVCWKRTVKIRQKLAKLQR